MAEAGRGQIAWRDTQRGVRVYFFDARLLLLFVPWVFVPGLWSTAAVLLAAAALWLAEARGYRFMAALRGLRAWSAGRRRALRRERTRHLADFG